MKAFYYPFVQLFVFLALFCSFAFAAHAQESTSQKVDLAPGWNIVSTPKILSSHAFSVGETSENFDIYVLDATKPTGWATMADLGQTEFTPLYGYFVNNKTGTEQTLTFNYDTTLFELEKMFERQFGAVGWYSLGVANGSYAKAQGAAATDTNNPSRVLSLLQGKHDLVIDFTDAHYSTNRKSVALSDPWKAVVPADIDDLNDLRETKGYAIYIKEAGAKYNGFQNAPVPFMDKLFLKTSSEDPDATTLQLKSHKKSDWLPVFAFELDTEDSANDVEIASLQVTVTVGSSNYGSIVNNARLRVGGNSIDGVEITNGDTSVATLTFAPATPLVIGAGDSMTAELELEFKALAPDDEGATVSAAITSENAAAMIAESTDIISVSGTVAGDTHTLRSSGAVFELTSTSQTLRANSETTTDDDEGVFVLKFDVTAFEQDVFIPKSSTWDTELTSAGVNFVIEDSTGVAVTSGTSTASLSSNASSQGSYFKVNEGEVKSFTLTVNYDPAVRGFYQVQLYSVNYNADATSPTKQQLAFPAEDFETGPLSI